MKKFEEALLEITQEGRLLQNEPMAKHTTFRVGGPTDYYLVPKREQLNVIIQCCKEYQIPYLVIGNGSNLLVSDMGIRGVVIEIGKNISEVTIEKDVLRVEAGSLLSRAARIALEESMTGMEFAAGIPGCVGGAVVMNAGAYGGEMKNILKAVTVLTPEGTEKRLTQDELELSYRHSCILQKQYIVLEAELELEYGNKNEIQKRMETLKVQRNEKQPLEYPSAGSTFKRPVGYYAGKLIMDAGLRGFQIGGAAVSAKHCGFIINKEQATASDIYNLMKEVEQRVQQQFGVTLEPEVKMVGDFA